MFTWPDPRTASCPADARRNAGPSHGASPPQLTPRRCSNKCPSGGRTRPRWVPPRLPAGEAAPAYGHQVRCPAGARVHRLASVEESTTGTSRHDSARPDETSEPRRAVELSDAQVNVAGGRGHSPSRTARRRHGDQWMPLAELGRHGVNLRHHQSAGPTCSGVDLLSGRREPVHTVCLCRGLYYSGEYW